jgi:asparagine synthase (glutamine-hydrolysing)
VVSLRRLESLYASLPFGGKKRSALGDKVLKYSSMLLGRNAPDMYRRASSVWQQESLKELAGENSFSQDDLIDEVFEGLLDSAAMTKMMCADFKKYMVDDVLTKVDRASMAVSIEAREPFLDHDLVEFAATLPLRMKYRNGESKYLLKKVLYRYLPPEWFTQPKQGFASPIGAWLRGSLRNDVDDARLKLGRIRDNGILNSAVVDDSIRRFYSSGDVGANQVWLLLQYQLWRDNWV